MSSSAPVAVPRQRLSRMYAALSALNELVAQARSAEALLQGTCEIAVASGDFDIAVVRHIEREAQLRALAQAAYLRAAGCEAMQGFLVSRPLPAVDCLALLRSGRRLALDGA
jgi:sensor c-di-GMP phosphodiesterase-like protein